MKHPSASGLRTLLVAGIALLPASGAAQTPDLRFERISIDQGLSQSSVYAILEDRMGFLWIGTDDGLNRYDGYRFEVLRSSPGQPGSLSHNRIRALCEDSGGVLWIGTHSGGLNRYDRRSRTFTHYRHDPEVAGSLAADRVWALHQDRSGTLWVGTGGSGLDRLATGQPQADRNEPVQAGIFSHLRHDPGDPTSLSDDFIRALYEDRAGNLWVGTQRGLNRIDAATRALTRHLPDSQAGSVGYNSVLSIHEDRHGRLWLGSWSGLMRFDPRTASFAFYGAASNEPGDPGRNIRDIHQDLNGTLWLATLGRALPDRPGSGRRPWQ